MADYPDTITSFDTKTDNVDTVQAQDIIAVQDEVEAIQTELGTDPAGSETDVDDRLTAIESDVSTNTSNISTNTGNISTNTTDVTALEGVLEVNESEVIADDAVYSWTPGETTGLVIVAQIAGTTPRKAGMFGYRTAATVHLDDLGSSGIADTTGVLAGTTGADSTATISVHTDGKIYFENRCGASRTWGFTVIPLPVS